MKDFEKKIAWAGWSILGIILFGWMGWISIAVINSPSTSWVRSLQTKYEDLNNKVISHHGSAEHHTH